MIATTVLLIIGAVFLIGTLPLYIAVKIMGGEVTLLRVLGVKLLVAVAAVVLAVFLKAIGSIVAGIATLVIYKLVFDLSFGRAIIAWVIETLVMVGLVAVAIVVGIVSLAGLF